MFEESKERLVAFYRRPRIRRGIKFGVLVVLGVGWILSRSFNLTLSPEQSVLVLLTLLIASVEVLETKVYDIESAVKNPVRAFLSNYEAKKEIEGRVQENPPDRAYLVAYSGSTNTSGNLNELVKSDAHVHLLIKHPNNVVVEDEQGLIESTLRPLLQFNWEWTDVDNLDVRFYTEQASVKGTKLDDFLVLSWYTFAETRGRKVMGHENAAIRATKDSGEMYGVLNNWFMDVYYHLWANGTSPVELIESGDCPPALARIVDGRDSDDKRERLELMSSTQYETIQDMFPEAA